MSERFAQSAIAISVVYLCVGCDSVSWPSPQRVDSLRVFGVRAEPASLSPGKSSELSIICADGGRGAKEDPVCDVQIAWFADCNNPKQNDPLNCFDRYTSRSRELSSPLADTPKNTQFKGFHFGPTFQFTAPDDVLTQKVRVEDQEIKYGVSYIFFAVCAGKLYPDYDAVDRLPVACRSRDSDERLDQSRFVVGFTTVYSYDLVVNRNPEIVEVSFDRVTIPFSCSVSGDCPNGFECSVENQCVPVVKPCSKDGAGDCTKHCLRLTLDPMSFKLFTIDGTKIDAQYKSVWYDYFSNIRDLAEYNDWEKRALNDRDGGVHEKTSCINWYAPPVPTEHAHIWVIIRDDRGGLTAWDQRIIVR